MHRSRQPWDGMKKLLIGIFWGLVALGHWQPLNAQSTEDQFLPEIDTYLTINPVARAEMIASRTKDGSTLNSATLGGGVDFFIGPIHALRHTNEDDSNRQLLTLGVTYRSINNVDKPNENRLQFDMTPRYRLPADLLLADRNRIELRIISGGVTWRYRNRLTVQRTFVFRHLALTPYGRVEGFYDISKGYWSEATYSGGANITLTKRIEIEPYYERQDIYGSSPSNVNGFGLTLSIYFRRSAATRANK